MKKKHPIFFTGLIVLCLMLTLGLAGCGSQKEEAETYDGYIGFEKAQDIAKEAASKETGKDIASLITPDLTLDDEELGEKYRNVDSEGKGKPVYALTVEEKVYIIDAVTGEILETRNAPDGED